MNQTAAERNEADGEVQILSETVSPLADLLAAETWALEDLVQAVNVLTSET